MRSPFVLGVDLDGTCADFYTGLRPIAAEWLGVPEQSLGHEFSWDLPEWGVAQAPGGYPNADRVMRGYDPGRVDHVHQPGDGGHAFGAHRPRRALLRRAAGR